MLLIVAHHYVVHGGIMNAIKDAPVNVSSVSMLLLGVWVELG